MNGQEVTIVGDVPLTGILSEETGEPVSFVDFDLIFEMGDKEIHKIRDVEYSLNIIPKNNLKGVVRITYIVTDSFGEIRFYDEDELSIQGETFIEGDLDRYKAKDVVLKEGEYVFSVRVFYGNKEKVFSEQFELTEIPEWLYSLKQLFDIKMEIDNIILKDASELEARVIFESFGSEPTPVDLTFFVYDVNDKEIFKRSRDIVVETEMVMFEDFDDFEAGPGEYMVVMRSVYNVDIEDYYEQKIVIEESIDYLPFIVAGGFLVAGVVVFFLLRRGKRK
jgi:hypothetical protein